MCRNPFDISRKELLTHIRRMRVNFIKAALSGIQLQEAGMYFGCCRCEMSPFVNLAIYVIVILDLCGVQLQNIIALCTALYTPVNNS